MPSKKAIAQTAQNRMKQKVWPLLSRLVGCQEGGELALACGCCVESVRDFRLEFPELAGDPDKVFGNQLRVPLGLRCFRTCAQDLVLKSFESSNASLGDVYHRSS